MKFDNKVLIKYNLLIILCFFYTFPIHASITNVCEDSIRKEVVLKNYLNDKDVLSQFVEKNNKPISNARIIISEDVDLRGKKIVIGPGCILDFRSGVLCNGEVVGNSTSIECSANKIFDNIHLFGLFSIDYIRPEWFGAIGDGMTDDTAPIMDAINNLHSLGGGILQFSSKDYAISSLVLTKVSCVELRGTSGGGGPWKRRSRLLCITPVEVMIRTASETSKDKEISEFYGHSITINGLFIDGNKRAKVGVNCLSDTRLEKTCIRGCLGDGIVLMPMTYPVDINDCEISYNDGNGILVRAPYTTVYKIRNCEINHNGRWGVLINAGAGISLENLVIQANKSGGLKIQQIPGDRYKHITWLGKISIYNVYFEGNCTLGENDEEYDGKEQLQILGLNHANQSFIGKIPYVSIFSISGAFESVRIEGTSYLFAPDLKVDWSKNIPSILNLRASTIKIGSSFFNADLTEYDCGNRSDLFKLMSGNSVIKNTQKIDYQKIGDGRFINGSISYTGLELNGNSIVFLYPQVDFIKEVVDNEEYLVGNGVITSDSGKISVNIWFCDTHSETMLYMTNVVTGKTITTSDLGTQGDLYVNMMYQK